MQFLTTLVITNAIAGACQLCGAIAIDIILLAGSTINTNVRQGIYLVSAAHSIVQSNCEQGLTAVQFVCSFDFCLRSFERRVIGPLRALARTLPPANINTNNSEGAVILDSLESIDILTA